MLLTAGALGYEAATLQEVAERAGVSRAQFQRHFGSREECFAAAYEAAAERLVEDVLEAGREAPSGNAWVAHQQMVDRLVTAIDSAREQPGALPSSSPMTAGFMVGAIEESIAMEIGAGRAAEAQHLLPDLTHLVVLNYFGEDEAWLELRPEAETG